MVLLIMQIIDVLLLGILQGLTEFLPVSSSGHLVIGQYLLGISPQGNALEILFHIGTLGSVIFVFFDDLKKIYVTINEKSTQKLLIHLIIATIPAAIVGFLFKNSIAILFESIKSVGFALLFTGLILIISSRIKNKNSNHSLYSSILVGFSQSIAIIPGISRSGMTITMLLFLGFSPKDSAKFSFLLSVPIITGAGILGLQNIQSNTMFSPEIIITALFSSFFVGVFALKALLKILMLGKFYFFGIYCIFLSMVSIFI